MIQAVEQAATETDRSRRVQYTQPADNLEVSEQHDTWHFISWTLLILAKSALQTKAEAAYWFIANLTIKKPIQGLLESTTSI